MRKQVDKLSIDGWLMGMASYVASRSSWPGMKVGCVVARNGRVVSTGYNGTPRGWKGSETKKEKEVFCHAEENAIVNAARYGISLEGCFFYVTVSPCVQCARMMVNVGAKAVLYGSLWDEHSDVVHNLLFDSGVKFMSV